MSHKKYECEFDQYFDVLTVNKAHLNMHLTFDY